MERMVVVSFRIPRKMFEDLKMMAEMKNVTISDLVREAVAGLIKDVSGRVIPDPRMERELRIIRAVKDVAGKINRDGIIDKHELYSYLREKHGLSYYEIANRFLVKLREELQRKNFVLVEVEDGDFVVIDIIKLVRSRTKGESMVVANA